MTKADHSVAQPIVCCIGASVAGQATQFLFERTLVSQGSDWRAISVEVSADRLSTACEGMLAMRFRGLRLFGDFQIAGVSELAAEDQAAQFVGRLTSGIQQQGDWILWDHVGCAWIDILRRAAGDMPSIIWLHGNSRTTRSTVVALASLMSSSPKWLWTQAPALDAEAPWLKLLSGRSLSGRAAEGRIQPQIDLVGAKAIKLAIVSEESSLPDELPETLVGLPLELIIPASLKLPDALANLPTQRISSSELAVAGEAYDFQRWTGQSVDIHLLQDAYDEYCDF